jgi:phage gpG-like protein
MITAQVDASRVKERLNGSSSKVLAALKGQLEIQTGMLANYIRADKLSGQVLKNRTGNLRNSVLPMVDASGVLMTGKVYVDSTALYGAYQEYGAHIPDRYPVNAKALRWYAAGGSPIFAMHARAFDLPPRPFMAPALAEKSAEITAALQTSVNQAIQE